MPVRYNPFYKAVVLDVGLIETVITDERHFPDKETAERHAKEFAREFGHTCKVIERESEEWDNFFDALMKGE